MAMDGSQRENLGRIPEIESKPPAVRPSGRNVCVPHGIVWDYGMKYINKLSKMSLTHASHVKKVSCISAKKHGTRVSCRLPCLH